MTHMALKLVYDHVDGLVAAPYDVTYVKEAMYKYFQVRKLQFQLDFPLTHLGDCIFIVFL